MLFCSASWVSGKAPDDTAKQLCQGAAMSLFARPGNWAKPAAVRFGVLPLQPVPRDNVGNSEFSQP